MSSLSKLNQTLIQLAWEANKLDQKRGSQYQPLFDPSLFSNQNRYLLTPCVEESQQLLKKIEQEQCKLDPSITAIQFWCERLVSQITAIKKELDAPDVRKNEPDPFVITKHSIHKLQQDVRQHKDWLIQLETGLQIRKQGIEKCTTLNAQKLKRQEIMAYEGRIQRCQASLAKILQQIALREESDEMKTDINND